MTAERAAEIVMACEAPAKYDIFGHFVDYFGFSSVEKQEWFAMLCGFGVARDIRPASDPEGA